MRKETVYGYLRVSTQEQREDRQVDAMLRFGVPCENLIVDHSSGKNFDRNGYRRLLGMLRHGDTLVIKSIDRLGRNYEEIIEQWRLLTQTMCVSIVVLDMPILDTRGERDLMGRLISDIVLELLSFVAQQEREYIRTRTAEGMAAARARGVRLGRKCLAKPDGYRGIYEKWKSGELSANRAGNMLGVSRNTFLKWARE